MENTHLYTTRIFCCGELISEEDWGGDFEAAANNVGLGHSHEYTFQRAVKLQSYSTVTHYINGDIGGVEYWAKEE